MNMDITLLEIALEDQLTPKRVAATNGGEYHSPCPGCGGKDRFIIWSENNRYYCRKCGKSGDVIQYFRDFHGCSFKEACEKAHIFPEKKKKRYFSQSTVFVPKKANPPTPQWQFHASAFIKSCHIDLINNPSTVAFLKAREFTIDSIKRFQIGWNKNSFFAEWLGEGFKRKIWLPKGIVIPYFKGEALSKIKIRRTDWHSKDHYPKYVEVQGSMAGPAVYRSDLNSSVLILESELDAMLVQQEAEELCSVIALGGASKKPDKDTHAFLLKAPSILFSLDYDEAGIKPLTWWKKQYSNLIIWMAPFEKSVGDAILKGLDVKTWLSLLEYKKR